MTDDHIIRMKVVSYRSEYSRPEVGLYGLDDDAAMRLIQEMAIQIAHFRLGGFVGDHDPEELRETVNEVLRDTFDEWVESIGD